MGLTVRVAGNARRYLAPYAPGTAYVVEAGDAALVVDCGLGTAGGLAAALSGRAPAAVAVSHFHFDHAGDLPALAAALPAATPFLLPPEGTASLDHLARAYRFEGAFEVAAREAPSEPWRVGPFTLRAAPAQHSAPAFALCVEAAGRRVVLAGDGARCPALEELARGADLLVAHTLLPDVEPESEHARIHMTGEAAGRLARDAGARRLLLSHVFHRTAPDDLLAAAAFSRAEVAETGAAYEV